MTTSYPATGATHRPAIGLGTRAGAGAGRGHGRAQAQAQALAPYSPHTCHPFVPQGASGPGKPCGPAIPVGAHLLWVRHFDAEQRLYARGAAGRAAYLIESGIVRFERVTAAGQRRITRVAGQGDLIGQEALLLQGYRDDAVVCVPATVQVLPTPLALDASGPAGLSPQALMSRWQAALDESEFWASEVASGPARRRVLQLLARLHRHRDERERVWLPRRDQMGDMLNITVETCSRVLSALRREGVLRLLPPRHVTFDWDRFQQAQRDSDR